MPSGMTQIAATIAVLAIGASAVPMHHDQYLQARQPTAADLARLAGKVVKDAAHGTVVDAAHQAINDKLNPPKPVDPKVAAAVSKASGGFSPGAVNAVINNPKIPKSGGGSKKRSLYEYMLAERDFEEDLFARQPTAADLARLAGKVVKDAAHGTVVDAAHQAINDRLNPPKPVDPKVSAAISKASGGFSSGAVNSVINNPKIPKSGGSSKKRSLYETLLAERDFEKEYLYARQPTAADLARLAGKAAKDLAHGTVVDAAHQAINDRLNPPKPVDPKVAAAVSQASGGFSGGAVNAVVNNPHLKSGGKKRDLDALIDVLVFRALELEDLD